MDLITISEIGILILFLICLYHAIRHNRTLMLFFILINPFIFEELAFKMYEAVSYAGFHIFIADIPLTVILGWTVLFYSSMITTDMLGIAHKYRPFLDTVLLLNVGVTIDLLATRVGFWSWNIPVNFFGVPYSNFFAWLLYGFLLAFFIRNRSDLKGLITATALTHLIGISIGLIWYYMLGAYHTVTFWSIISLFIIGLLLKARLTVAPKADSLYLLLIPLSFHIFFTGIVFIYDIQSELWVLLVIMTLVTVNMALNVYLYTSSITALIRKIYLKSVKFS